MRPSSLATIIVFALACGDARATDDKRLLCLSNSETAQRSRIAGKLRDARERFLQCAREECPAVVRQDCEASLAQVDAALPTVTVVARDDDGRDVQRVRVSVDGAPRAESIEGRSFAVDPGAHQLFYEAPGYAAVEQAIVVREGEKQRVLEVRFGSRSSSTQTRSRTAAFAFAGIGVAALGVGTFFGISALSGYESMKDRCSADLDCSDAEASRVRTRAIMADISLGVALVAGGIATWLFLEPASAQRASSAISPAVRARE